MEIEKANLLSEQFHKTSGLNLQEEVAHNPQLSGMTDIAFINRTEMIILEEIKARSPSTDLEDLNENEKSAIDKAIVEQMLYMLCGGDFTLFTGYDPSANTIIDLQSLRKRIMSPLAVTILTNAGLLYCGIGSHCGSYLEERSYWGKKR